MANQVKRAVLVGINKYALQGNNLKGCVNDALMMGKLLTENFGFNPEDIRLLTDERATTEAMRDRLRWLVEGAGPGSVLLFHYSGHGSQVRDRDGDELEDSLDEILCPHDLDWDDPFTDDEIAELIKRVPSDVNFTIVLDCCHSGTGTREFFKEPTEGRAAGSRYLVPPPDVAFRAAAGVDLDSGTPERTVNMRGIRPRLRVRGFGSSIVEQNAVLISGCRSDQTSADAWIDNDYHGALTYSLYWALREHRFSLSHGDLVEEAGGWLESNRFEQVPQLEGPVHMQRWAFAGTTELRPILSSLAPAPAAESLAAIAPETRVVFVHGIGDHKPGYSDRWRAAFNRYLALAPGNYVEVVWDDVFDEPTRRMRGLGDVPALTEQEEAQEEAMKQELRSLLLARHEVLQDVGAAPKGSNGRVEQGFRDLASERGLLDWLINFDEYVGDFAKYLVSEQVRKSVNARLEAAIDPLLRAGQPVVILSHSWGTVVAYETLRRLGSPSGAAFHATLGSPLWMWPVRKALGMDGRRYACGTWINLDAAGDLIGGALHPTFEVSNDYKVPCVGSDAHSSYFHPDNLAVQRDIIAKALQGLSASGGLRDFLVRIVPALPAAIAATSAKGAAQPKA